MGLLTADLPGQRHACQLSDDDAGGSAARPRRVPGRRLRGRYLSRPWQCRRAAECQLRLGAARPLCSDGRHRHAGVWLCDAAGHDHHGQRQHRLLRLRLHRHARGCGNGASGRRYLPRFRAAAGLQGDDPLRRQDAGDRALLSAGWCDAVGRRRLYRRSDHAPAADGYAHGRRAGLSLRRLDDRAGQNTGREHAGAPRGRAL